MKNLYFIYLLFLSPFIFAQDFEGFVPSPFLPPQKPIHNKFKIYGEDVLFPFKYKDVTFKKSPSTYLEKLSIIIGKNETKDFLLNEEVKDLWTDQILAEAKQNSVLQAQIKEMIGNLDLSSLSIHNLLYLLGYDRELDTYIINRIGIDKIFEEEILDYSSAHRLYMDYIKDMNHIKERGPFHFRNPTVIANPEEYKKSMVRHCKES